MHRDSVAGAANHYGMDKLRFEPSEARYFLFYITFQIDPGAHPASCTYFGKWGSFLMIKPLGEWS